MVVIVFLLSIKIAYVGKSKLTTNSDVWRRKMERKLLFKELIKMRIYGQEDNYLNKYINSSVQVPIRLELGVLILPSNY